MSYDTFTISLTVFLAQKLLRTGYLSKRCVMSMESTAYEAGQYIPGTSISWTLAPSD